MMNDFNPAMLRLARQCRMGLTQKKFADELGVSQGKISKWEEGLLIPGDAEADAIAETLGFPRTFFSHDGEEYGFGTCYLYHRKRQSLPGKHLNALHARMNVIGLGVARLLAFPKVSLRSSITLPTYPVDGRVSPEDVARKVRADWGLPRGPIPDLMRVVESTGAIIIPMDFATDQLDAVSVRPQGTPPLVFTNFMSAADRQRFTLAHELGHLIMHGLPTKDSEKEADRFAAELLMPSRDIRAELAGMSLDKAKTLKRKWRTAMSSIIKRAQDTKAITDYRARQLFIEMGPQRKRESVVIEPDQPRTLEKLIEAHKSRLNHTVGQLAEITFCAEVVQFSKRYERKKQQPFRLVQ